ncbi:MAG: hypothetical protein H6779_01435 [Candidatus Nomurabacteria bacterium]|nr:MAG: hypothetical protein H6779_01435 [Candidatus Nomurabacteria bacterium]
MTNTTENPNDSKKGAQKLIMAAGLIAIIVFFAWSAVQIVKIFPTAVSSLASLADNVYNYREGDKKQTISATSDRSIMNSGESLEVWWENTKTSGTYTFNYECKDGVAIDIKTTDKEFVSLSCGSSYDLGLVDRLEMQVDSEKARFAEIAYTISYIKNNSSEPDSSQTKSISVLNTNIAETESITDTDTQSENENKPEEAPSDTTTEPTETKETVSTQPKPVIPTETVYTYAIPVSDPNGSTDLVVSDLKIGVENNTDTFIETNSIIQDIPGVIKFTVHNIGNKTSNTWVFEVELPGNVTYKSDDQDPLKPNERAIITINFPAVNEIGKDSISIQTFTRSDANITNNYLNESVTVTQ